MIVDIQGILFKKMNYKTGTSAAGNAWQSLEVLVGTPLKNGSYTNVLLRAANDRCNAVRAIEQGSEVKIKAYIAAREYKERWYNSFEVLDIHLIAPPHIEPAPEPRDEDLLFENEAEDLPF